MTKTVSQLVEELLQLPQDLQVVTRDIVYGDADPEPVVQPRKSRVDGEYEVVEL